MTGWLPAITRATRRAGYEPGAAEPGIGSHAAVGNRELRGSSPSEVSRAWRHAIAVTGDPAFGLKVAAEARPATFHVVGYAMGCSATLGRALQRFTLYSRLVTECATAALRLSDDRAVLELFFDPRSRYLPFQAPDIVLAAVLSVARWITGEPLRPAEVRVPHSRVSPEAHRAFFGCSVIYDRARTCLIFHASDLGRPIPAADEDLAALLEHVGSNLLQDRMDGRFATRVKDLLIAQFESGSNSKRDVARWLDMTERTLLRRLRSEGTTFAKVLQGARERLAAQFLQSPGMSRREIARALGYSDESSFSRAFKRWTGHRPPRPGARRRRGGG